MTSTPLLMRYEKGTWRPLSASYGPTGRDAPWGTPAYSTPADFQVASLSALQTLLTGGTVSSGQVVELTAPSVSGAAFTTPGFNGGSLSWANNVLVRPPLGSRCLITDSLQIQTLHVTFAGFDAVGALTIQRGNVTPTRTGFWRTANVNLTGGGFLKIGNDCVDCFLCEPVAPYAFYGTGDIGDWINVTAPTGSLVEGAYIAPRHLGITPSLYLLDTTDTSVRDIVTTISGLAAPLTVQYIRVNTPGSLVGSGRSISVDLKKNGVSIYTLTAPRLVNETNGSPVSALYSDYAYGRNPGPSGYATFNNGDILTVSITASTGVPPKVSINLGGVSASHQDTFQTFSTSYPIGNLTVRECVLIGATNSAMQLADLGGVFRLTRNWIAKDDNYAVNLSLDGSRSAGAIVILDDNWVAGRFNATGSPTDTAQEWYVVDNHLTSWSPATLPADFTLAPSNTTDANMYVIPPDLSDLTLVWPECPYVPVNPYGNKWRL